MQTWMRGSCQGSRRQHDKNEARGFPAPTGLVLARPIRSFAYLM